MDILIFCLGAGTAIVLALLVVIVVTVLGLSKKVTTLENQLGITERNLSSEAENIYRTLDTYSKEVIDADKKNLADSHGYTDSRVDKVLERVLALEHTK